MDVDTLQKGHINVVAVFEYINWKFLFKGPVFTLINLKGINSILDKDNRTHNNPFIMKIPENIVVL